MKYATIMKHFLLLCAVSCFFAASFVQSGTREGLSRPATDGAPRVGNKGPAADEDSGDLSWGGFGHVLIRDGTMRSGTGPVGGRRPKPAGILNGVRSVGMGAFSYCGLPESVAFPGGGASEAGGLVVVGMA
jgi:hypothetical protein